MEESAEAAEGRVAVVGVAAERVLAGRARVAVGSRVASPRGICTRAPPRVAWAVAEAKGVEPVAVRVVVGRVTVVVAAAATEMGVVTARVAEAATARAADAAARAAARVAMAGVTTPAPA